MKKKFKIENLDCGHCAAKLEGALAKIEGVNEVKVNFLTSKVSLDIEDCREEEIIEQIFKATKKTLPDVKFK